jgi:hypothetical protein
LLATAYTYLGTVVKSLASDPDVLEMNALNTTTETFDEHDELLIESMQMTFDDLSKRLGNASQQVSSITSKRATFYSGSSDI